MGGSEIKMGALLNLKPVKWGKNSFRLAEATDYKKIIEKSIEAFEEWRKIPAPERGQLVRQMGDALRDYKDNLGSLVSLEMGKIKQEGDGGTEMIDIADFAVGQSRMLYGKTMILKGLSIECMNNGTLLVQ